MFLKKILGMLLTTAPENQELDSQQSLRIAKDPRQQLELITALPSIEQ